MTNKIIDADAFSEFLYNSHDKVVCSCCRNFIFTAKQKINEMATYAPKPQESIFDADGWCWDLSLAPIGKEIILAITSESERGNYASIGIKLDDDEFQYDYESLSMVYAWKLMSTLPKLPTGGNNEN